MSAAKWQVRYERQVQANNLLSDKLRTTRRDFAKKEGQLLSYIGTLREDNKRLLTESLVAQVEDLPEVEKADA